MNKKDLLIEIGTEELPPKALKQLARSFAEEIHAGLDKNKLPHKAYKWLASPRRLAVIVEKLVIQQSDQEVSRRGPAVSAAYDNEGKPTRAALGFAKSCGVEISDLETLETDKGSWLISSSVEKGRASADLLPEIINSALDKLPVPKRMRWGDHETEFVRPVHWSIVILGRDVVPCKLLGTLAGNESRGHRFHYPETVKITSAAQYAKKLKEKAHVIVDFDERKSLIRKIITEKGESIGGKTIIEESLLDEVTSLVEWPVVIAGNFEEKYLELPKEILISSMQDHQKYFAVTDTSGKRLLNYFITIANIDSKSPDEIKKGNEKVIRPRLADAAFFWQRDRKKPLAEFTKALEDVVFQKQLGTLADKTERVKKLSAFIASQLGVDDSLPVRAASLAKCDLLTEVVGEFPGLQGVMGRYYALDSNEAEAVALALDEQYMPRFAGDQVPGSITGQILAIAEKLDTLVGIFATGQTPSGEKDPFALRRAALGCMRILIECELALDLPELIDFQFPLCAGDIVKNSKKPSASLTSAKEVSEIFNFMMERLRRYYLDMNTRADVFDAVLARSPGSPYDFHQRVLAVNNFIVLPESTSLAAANKRIQNILKQSNSETFNDINEQLLGEPAEKLLASALDKITGSVQPLLDNNDYDNALTKLAELRDPVDNFFDEVMVMCDDEALKLNRLALLRRINSLFMTIADISRLQVQQT